MRRLRAFASRSNYSLPRETTLPYITRAGSLVGGPSPRRRRFLQFPAARSNTYTYLLSNRKIILSGPRRFLDSAPIDSPQRRRLPPLLRRAWYELNRAFRRRIAHTGVTPDQFTVLRTLTEHPAGLTQSEITRAMASDPNTIASMLDRMETTGLLARRPHETDQRARRIRLRPLGRKKYEVIRQLAVELQLEVLSALPPAKREEFLENLTVVADACQAAAGSSRFPSSMEGSAVAVRRQTRSPHRKATAK